ncbi:MAG: YitT family protein [Oscillospiraceae bacterium]
MDQKGWRALTVMYGKIIIGSIIFAFGFRFFLYNNGIMSGGTSGVAMIINQLTMLPVGMLTIVVNVPIFILAWKKLGFFYMLNSTIAMVVSSLLVDAMGFLPFTATNDILLASLYGGVIKGLGLGIIYSTGLATGGGDITVRILRRKYPYINLGTIMLSVDATVVMTYAVIFSRYDKAMYTMISMYVAAKVIDLILYGSLNAKLCLIITDYSNEIQHKITEQLHRGVTLLDGHGAYSGKNKNVILCTVKKSQMFELRTLTRAVDPAAFFVVTDAREVFGRGFSDIMSND